MSDPKPILITCVGGTMVPSALRWLRENSRIALTVHGADANDAPLAMPFLDGFHKIPLGGESGYVDRLFAIARREGIRVIVPWSDGEAFALSAARTRFANIGCDVLASPSNVLDVLKDKMATYRRLQGAGVAVPEHTVIDHPSALEAVLSRYGYPERSVVVKPVDGRGGRGMYVLVGRDEPPAWLGSGQRESRLEEAEFSAQDPAILVPGETLVMPCLNAPVFDADVLVREGTVLSVVVRERHNPTGIPWTGNTICRKPDFESYARRVAEVLNLDGAHDVDLMSDANGAPALLEINPRMSGSLAATLAAGAPFLDAALASRLGIDLPVPLPDRDVSVLPYVEAVSV